MYYQILSIIVSTWKCMKGTWISCNKFEDVFGHEHKVYPYKMRLEEYEPFFPIECYIQTRNDIITNVVLR